MFRWQVIKPSMQRSLWALLFHIFKLKEKSIIMSPAAVKNIIGNRAAKQITIEAAKGTVMVCLNGEFPAVSFSHCFRASSGVSYFSYGLPFLYYHRAWCSLSVTRLLSVITRRTPSTSSTPATRPTAMTSKYATAFYFSLFWCRFGMSAVCGIPRRHVDGVVFVGDVLMQVAN